jgi:hypothetical protein
MRTTVAASLLVLAVACGGEATPSPAVDPTTYAAQIASTDLYAGAPQDVQIGVLHSDPEQGVLLLTGGEIPVTISHEGMEPIQTDAAYLAAPGTPSEPSATLTPPSEARGVYVATDVTFPQEGIWTASATIPGGASVQTQFEVLAEPSLPAPGQRAMKTENLTASSPGDPMAVDSRAQDGAPIPDPQLHQDTIAGAVEDGRAAVVLFATPVYCASQFCGPTTDALEQIAAEGPADADYIHVEIWNDYAKQAVNEAAADWLLRDESLTEPWLYLIGPDGRIEDRWGPLFDPADVLSALNDVAA